MGIAVTGLREFLALYQTKSASSGNDNGFEFDQNTFIAYVQRKAKFVNSNKIKAGSSLIKMKLSLELGKEIFSLCEPMAFFEIYVYIFLVFLKNRKGFDTNEIELLLLSKKKRNNNIFQPSSS